MRKINEIILHCSATPEGRDVKMEEIRRWHLKRGFFDIGYHYVIELDGTVRNGRSIELIGAHCLGHNKNSIGICYVGGTSPDPSRGGEIVDSHKGSKQSKKAPLGGWGSAAETRTPAQKSALLYIIRHLMKEYNLTIDAIHCHNEYANKACPSFSRETIIKELEAP